MRIDQRSIGPGIFLILVGAIPLAVREGLVDAGQLAWTWRVWPLLLICAGVGILRRATATGALAGLVAAVVGGVIVGSLLAGAVDGFGSLACPGGAVDPRPFPPAAGEVASAGTLQVALGCGDATVSTTAGRGWSVTGASADGRPPLVRSTGDLVSVRSRREADGSGAAWVRLRVTVPDDVADWDLTLNAGSMSARPGPGARALLGTVNAGSLLADLSAATGLESLTVTVNAGSGTLRLPDASLTGSLTVNAGAMTLCAPPGVGLRLTTKRGGLGGNDYGTNGLSEADGVWTTPGWRQATHLIDLETTANAGAFSLNPKEGCR